jgi:asparagine synthase (glutamine-hydrolysing)
MCGIWAWIYPRGKENPDHTRIHEECLCHLYARGPEGNQIQTIGNHVTLGFTRLAINGLNPEGMQPFTQSKDLSWVCNGEIYNAKELEKKVGFTSSSGSDCEPLGSYWRTCDGDAVAFARGLDGVFGLVMADLSANTFVVARDPYGVRPLFYAELDESILFASERKALETFITTSGYETNICEFPPGQVWTITDIMHGMSLQIKKQVYHTVPWLKNPTTTLTNLRDALVSAVQKRLLTERPVAALLSGGIDSSLIAALVQRELRKLGKPPLKTFSIGMPGSTDLEYAKKVAVWIGSEHHEVLTTPDEMFSVIPQVIHDIESYDTTTVRASVGNWMVARAIKERTSCKVVFNGDGSDEVFGSYLYFYRSPSEDAFERESERLLTEISRYDVLRSDRSIASHGLEARTPFLDKQFVQVARSLPTDQRRPVIMERVEKDVLRKAFDVEGLLPSEVIWRKKEAFSDGVSSTEKSWFEEIQERILDQKLVPENWHEQTQKFMGGPVPQTPEQFYYRTIYEKSYKHTGDYWPYWMPRWSPGVTDPSARTLGL